MIDSNVLIYAFQADSPYHATALAAVTERLEAKSPCALSWQVIFEFLRVTTHPAVSQHPASPREAEAFIHSLLTAPAARVLTPGKKHFEFYESASKEVGGARGNDVHDVRLVALMREHDDREILTADDGFRRFKGIKVINAREE